MNFILLGYIIAWIIVIVVLAAIASAAYAYSKLTPMQQAQVTSIEADKHLIVLIISIVYIIVYHIS